MSLLAQNELHVPAWLLVVISVGSVLATAVVIPVIQNFINYKKLIKESERVDFQTILTTFKQENEYLRKQVENLNTRVAHLEAVSEHDLPIPMWSKDRAYRFQWCNRAFEERFLTPHDKTMTDIIGQIDTEIWGKDVAKALRVLEGKALQAPDRRASGTDFKLDNTTTLWTIYKWPVMRGNSHAAWMGMAVQKFANGGQND